MSRRRLLAREVAERERVSTETVLRWYRRGEFEGVAFRQPSGELRFWEDRLDAWEEERATTERGSVTRPAGRRPGSNLAPVTRPMSEEV
jgi:hypothetical protein